MSLHLNDSAKLFSVLLPGSRCFSFSGLGVGVKRERASSPEP